MSRKSHFPAVFTRACARSPLSEDEFANRQNMHLTLVELLDLAEYHPVWKDQPPVVFTSRVTAFRPMVDALGLLIGRQQSATTGHAEDKEREEAELENTAYEISQTLAGWFEANGRNADAWQAARIVRDLGRGASETPPPPAA